MYILPEFKAEACTWVVKRIRGCLSALWLTSGEWVLYTDAHWLLEHGHANWGSHFATKQHKVSSISTQVCHLVLDSLFCVFSFSPNLPNLHFVGPPLSLFLLSFSKQHRSWGYINPDCRRYLRCSYASCATCGHCLSITLSPLESDNVILLSLIYFPLYVVSPLH